MKEGRYTPASEGKHDQQQGMFFMCYSLLGCPLFLSICWSHLEILTPYIYTHCPFFPHNSLVRIIINKPKKPNQPQTFEQYLSLLYKWNGLWIQFDIDLN